MNQLHARQKSRKIVAATACFRTGEACACAYKLAGWSRASAICEPESPDGLRKVEIGKSFRDDPKASVCDRAASDDRPYWIVCNALRVRC